MQIFLRNFGHGQGPGNSKSWIVMPNTEGRLRFVGFGNEVIDFDIITEGLEAVGEPLRDVELMPVHARKLKFLAVPISRGSGPDVDDDVPNGSFSATHQFRFAVRIALIVHASQSPPASRVRYAVLRIVGLKPAGRELFNAEGASEEAAGVARPFQLNEPSITEPCWVKLHGTTSRMFGLLFHALPLGRLDNRPYMNFGHLGGWWQG